MKLVSSLIASCLAFTYAQNTTMMGSTEEPMSSTETTMYTTMESTEVIIYETVPYDGSDDPTADFTECDYYFMGTFDGLDDISVYLCGYTDDDDMGWTDIKLDIPSTRWVAFGMKSNGEVSDTDTFTNYDGYNVVIPINSADIEELYFTSDKSADPIELASSIDIISDKIEDGRRMLRLMRPETITEANLNDTGLEMNMTAADVVDYYFDYGDFSGCEDIARISVAYGPLAGAQFVAKTFQQATYGNRAAVSAKLDEEADDPCDGDGNTDDAPQQLINLFGTLIIGCIAMLF